MTTTAHHPTQLDYDRRIILIDTYAEQARRSTTVRTWGQFRARVLRRNRQMAFTRAWGLR